MEIMNKKRTIIKKIILIGGFFCSTFAVAQCPKPLNNLDIKIMMSPLVYDYSKTSKQMQSLEGQANPNLLGLYNGEKSVEINPLIEASGVRGGPACGAITKLNINIKVKPVIYISREAQQFSCTRQRTEQHEQLHYQFEVNALNRLKPYIQDLSKKYFGMNFAVNSEVELLNINKQRSNSFLNEVQQYMKSTTEPLHAKIDNPENYKFESSYCSYQENVAITKLLQMKL